jgi:leucyl-tRNA synthetase
LKLFEKGLAYEAEVPVNWCPALGTVLANEEVKDGVYIETGDRVERRSMRQWMLKITDYAESLLAGLDDLDWPDGIKEMQRHWIGRSVGAEVQFKVTDSKHRIEIFTTRPDTLFGCTYLVLAPEHELVDQITPKARRAEVNAYREATASRSDRERTAEAAEAPKTGVFTGVFAINPVNGERVPIWIADYVLLSYGTGAVFACPAHDERDYVFAKTFGLAITEVVSGGDIAQSPYTGDGEHVNSGFLNGLNVVDAKARIIDWLEKEGHGKGTVTYRLRDWLFSRQRYWGEPIPVIHVDGQVKPVAQSDLPITLPTLDEYRPTDDGRPPLARATAWMATTDPETGAPAIRETNTMPQWAGSCWYYLRFISPDRHDVAWDQADERYWMPVDLYVGGAEHATLHLLYARFWHHVLHDLGLVSTREPFQRLFNQGMIHATSFRDERGKYYNREDVQERDGVWSTKDGIPLETRREKMSKSKYNVVSPEDMCHAFGADSLRLYELFMGPLEDGSDWETGGVAGCRRFLDRVWRLVTDPDKLTEEAVDAPDAERALHAAIKKVTESVESLRFNTAISEMMVFVNEATKTPKIPEQWLGAFVRILAPFAPHIGEELWSLLGHGDSVAHAPFPNYDAEKIATATITLAIQVNGKLRGTIEVDAKAPESDVLAAVQAEENVKNFLRGKSLRKEIYVPGRIVNLVVE